MEPFKRLVRFGLDGKMGDGQQQFSWIHETDVCRAIAFLIENQQTKGVYNLSSPNPIRNNVFMKAVRKTLHIPFGIPQPKWLLELGAWMIGTETELIFKSRFVLPKRLLEEDFVFEYPEINGCLQEIFGKK